MAGDFEFHSPFWDPVSEEAKDLIKKMLTVDPRQRPSAQELLHSHPWFKLELEGGVHLGETAEALKRWNARRRFKSTGAAIIAANRFRAVFKAKGHKARDTAAVGKALLSTVIVEGTTQVPKVQVGKEVLKPVRSTLRSAGKHSGAVPPSDTKALSPTKSRDKPQKSLSSVQMGASKNPWAAKLRSVKKRNSIIEAQERERELKEERNRAAASIALQTDSGRN